MASVKLKFPIRRRFSTIRAVAVRAPTMADLAVMRWVWESTTDAWTHAAALVKQLTDLAEDEVSLLSPIDFVTIAEVAADAVAEAVSELPGER